MAKHTDTVPNRGRRVAAPSGSQKRRNVIILVALFGSILLLGALLARPGVKTNPNQATAVPEVDHVAPGFSLTAPDGTRISLADLRGQAVLVNFWGTWCPPCRAEMPAIQAAYERYHDRGFTVLAVNTGEQPELVASFAKTFGLTFPTLLDHDGQVVESYRVNGFPTSFFIDQQGIVRTIYRGPMSDDVIATAVEDLLAQQ